MPVFSLMYHDVVPPQGFATSGFSGDHPAADPGAVYKLDQEQFWNHLSVVTSAVDAVGIDRSRTAGALLEAGDRRARAELLAHGLCLLHFDDGGRGAMAAADQLEAASWRGHFWITTDYLGKPGFVTAADLCELQSRGHVVGSHSCSHPMRMSALADDELAREWGDSVAALQDALGQPVVMGSVPGGDCDDRVVASAARAGISLLFNSEPTSRVLESGGCLVLGRYSVKRSTPAHRAAAMAVGARAPRHAQWATWNAKKLLKRAGGRHWVALRRRILRP